MKVKNCPFCGGTFEIVAVDENGNLYNADDPEDLPIDVCCYLTYGVVHESLYNDCPIATVGRALLGDVEYDTRDEAIWEINRRFENGRKKNAAPNK